MKIISLNTWGGRAGAEKLLEFLKSNSDVDIFCFQEIWEGGDHIVSEFSDKIDTKLFSHMKEALADYEAFFHPNFYDFYGLAMFVKKSLKVLDSGDVFVYRDREEAFVNHGDNHSRNLQYVTFETANGPLTVLNIHGLWTGTGKSDNPDRIVQSENIIKFLREIKNPLVLCGDFNLLPDTKSIVILEDFGLRNMIKEYGVTTTRSSLYDKSVLFADYTFVSKEIEVIDFKMLPDQVSDHLAMYLEIK